MFYKKDNNEEVEVFNNLEVYEKNQIAGLDYTSILRQPLSAPMISGIHHRMEFGIGPVAHSLPRAPPGLTTTSVFRRFFVCRLSYCNTITMKAK